MTPVPWNIAAAIHAVGASRVAAHPALLHAGCSISFADLRTRAEAIACWLAALGLPRGAHVGHYLRNSNVYMELFTGAALIGMTHVNVNYRYLDDELVQLCTDLDIRVLFYEREFADRVMRVAAGLRNVVAFVEVGGGAVVNPLATSIAALYAHDRSRLHIDCSGEDLLIIATGGTTGLPKGTLWRHDDLWQRLNIGRGNALQSLKLAAHPATLAEHVANVESLPAVAPFLGLSPLMHGAGLMMALLVLAQGQTLLTLEGVRFDADAALEAIRRHGAGGMSLVGDAFAVPLLQALDRRAGARMVASLRVVISTGAALSAQCKAGFEAHAPGVQIIDSLGSSEASAFALSTPEPGVFKPLPNTRVLDDALHEIAPGSADTGVIYTTGNLPLGYYGDAGRSAATFPLIDGRRYLKTGDRCQVRADGMLVLLGRDSSVINTAGEKVYTVEVERVLLEYPGVTDVLVIGQPHPRFGSMVVAVVEGPGLTPQTLDETAIREHVRARLADYKVPRRVLAIASLQRAANGKPDYPFLTRWAAEQLLEPHVDANSALANR